MLPSPAIIMGAHNHMCLYSAKILDAPACNLHYSVNAPVHLLQIVKLVAADFGLYSHNVKRDHDVSSSCIIAVYKADL